MFFQKTLQNLKSLFSPGNYQKLPKTPPHNHYSHSVMDMDNNPSYKDLEKFYSDFTEQWDISEKEKARRRKKKKVVLSSSPARQEKDHDQVHTERCNIGLNNAQKKNQMEKREETDEQKNKRSLTHQRGSQKDSKWNSTSKRGNSDCVVEKKLRELEMLDMSDVDYVLDIEEVLHYYSRLTCPAYLEIVDKFFIEMYSEFFGGPAIPSVNSELKLRSVRSH